MLEFISLPNVIGVLSLAIPIGLNRWTKKYSRDYTRKIKSSVVRGGSVKFIRVKYLRPKPVSYFGIGIVIPIKDEVEYKEEILLTTHHPRSEYNTLISLPSDKYKFEERILDLGSCHHYLSRLGIKIPLVEASNIKLQEGDFVEAYRYTDNKKNLEIISDSRVMIENKLHINYTAYYITPWILYIICVLVYLYRGRLDL